LVSLVTAVMPTRGLENVEALAVRPICVQFVPSGEAAAMTVPSDCVSRT
jgi:hypothetical protein